MSQPENPNVMNPNQGTLRSGATLPEILVAIGIIGVLAAILAPAVMQARESSRRVQCKSNLRGVAQAVLASTEAKKRFPAAGNFLVRPDPAGGSTYRHNWVVDVLPWLDQANIADAWDKDAAPQAAPNGALAETHIPVLTCPSDGTLLGSGDLSYVVNGGIGWTGPPGGVITTAGEPIDLNANGVTAHDSNLDGNPSDDRLMEHLGLFFVENWPPGSGTSHSHRPATVTDGMSQTLMLAECIHAGAERPLPNDPPGHAGHNWASPLPWRTCFFVSDRICEHLFCEPGAVDYAHANTRTGPAAAHAINGQLEPAEGSSPFAASHHTGGVHVAFADGRVHFLSESIHGGVYAALVSPKGAELKSPLGQQLVSDSDY